MIVFTLSMPHANSWNRKWTGADRNYTRVLRNYDVPKEYWGKDFYHHWDDGWTACVSVSNPISSAEARKIERKSDGFCGYDWMIKSICKYGEIKYRKEWD